MEGFIRLVSAGVEPIARLTLCKGSEIELEQLFEDLKATVAKRIKITTIKSSGRTALSENQDILGFQEDDNTETKLKNLCKKYGIIVKLEDQLQSEPEQGKLRYSKCMNCGVGFQTAYISP